MVVAEAVKCSCGDPMGPDKGAPTLLTCAHCDTVCRSEGCPRCAKMTVKR